MYKIQKYLVKSLQSTATLLFIVGVIFLFNACSTATNRPIMVFTPKKTASQEVVAMENHSVPRKYASQKHVTQRRESSVMP